MTSPLLDKFRTAPSFITALAESRKTVGLALRDARLEPSLVSPVMVSICQIARLKSITAKVNVSNSTTTGSNGKSPGLVHRLRTSEFVCKPPMTSLPSLLSVGLYAEKARS